MECYVNDKWMIVSTSSPTLNGGTRGAWGGGRTPNYSDTIDFITISTAGNATDFGNLSVSRATEASCSSLTRGLWMGGYNPIVTTIDFVVFSSTANATGFGDCTNNFNQGALSNETRGVMAGGTNPSGSTKMNTMEYVTIGSTGNTVDFGDLLSTRDSPSGAASPTRGVFFGGGDKNQAPQVNNIIEFITIASTGNSTDFGDINTARSTIGVCSNSTRCLAGGGSIGYPSSNVIDFVTIATTGNAMNFGDLTQARGTLDATSSQTRGVFGGGRIDSPANNTAVNTIDFITIATTGDASDFGDLTVSRWVLSACSNGHGGL
tara:strand:- start:33 stop:992 length:960 start_codon:yes stop_codon:yes gene_type:complete